jgi:hypothetical protein
LAKKPLLMRLSAGPRAKSSVIFHPVDFLVRFASAELDSYRPGDWLNLREELETFTDTTYSTFPLALNVSPDEERPIQELLDDQFCRNAQQTAIRLLGGFVRNPTLYTVEGAGVVFLPSLEAHSLLRVVVKVHKQEDLPPVQVTLWADLMTVFELRAVLVLGSPAALERLRGCPECGAVFLRVRKQRYCSRKCVNKANMRTWLKSNRGRTSHRASSTRSYDKRVRASHPNATIAGRTAKRRRSK